MPTVLIEVRKAYAPEEEVAIDWRRCTAPSGRRSDPAGRPGRPPDRARAPPVRLPAGDCEPRAVHAGDHRRVRGTVAGREAGALPNDCRQPRGARDPEGPREDRPSRGAQGELGNPGRAGGQRRRARVQNRRLGCVDGKTGRGEVGRAGSGPHDRAPARDQRGGEQAGADGGAVQAGGRARVAGRGELHPERQPGVLVRRPGGGGGGGPRKGESRGASYSRSRSWSVPARRGGATLPEARSPTPRRPTPSGCCSACRSSVRARMRRRSCAPTRRPASASP